MSKKKLLLVGAGGFARVVSELAVLKHACVFIGGRGEAGTEICGIKVVGCILDLPTLFAEC